MIAGITEVISTVVSSLITSIFAYLVLKLLKEERSFLRVFVVVIISDVVMMFLPYISMLGIPIPWFGYLAISILISLFIYKFGLDLSWLHTIILVILTPIIAFVIGLILVFLGLGTILSLSFLT
jgi:hypothetical protein